MRLPGNAIPPQMDNIGPPTPRGVKTVFLLQLGTADQSGRFADALGTVDHGLLGTGDGSPAEGEGGLLRSGGALGSGGVHDDVWLRRGVNAGGFSFGLEWVS